VGVTKGTIGIACRGCFHPRSVEVVDVPTRFMTEHFFKGGQGEAFQLVIKHFSPITCGIGQYCPSEV